MKLKIEIDIKTSEQLRSRLESMTDDELCNWVCRNAFRNNARTVHRAVIIPPDQEPHDLELRYLVVWCIEEKALTEKTTRDHYEVFEDPESAEKRYQEIIQQPDTYSASICVPVNSTDYATLKGDQINALLSA